MPGRDLRRILAWLIGIRVGVATLLLGSAIFVQLTSPGAFPLEPLFYLIGVTYFLNIVWALTLKWAERWRWLIDVQLASDAIVVSGFIAVTGGITSYFAALYVLPIAAASSVQLQRGGTMLAVLSALIYIGIVLTQYFDPSGLTGIPGLQYGASLPAPRVAAYTTGLNVFLFFAIALLSGSLANRLQRADVRLERASHEIAHLQAFSEHVIDSLTSGLATTDLDGHIQSFNRAAEAITGHMTASVAGKPIEEILNLPTSVMTTLRAGSKLERGRRLESSCRTGDGRLIELGFTATHLRTPAGNAGLLFSFQDVTEFNRLERESRLRQRLAAVGEMAAGIAHEIRNPLASMSGSIQILRQELPLTDEQAQLMDIVLRESERLNDTIRSFLAYARPQRFSLARFDVRRVLNDAALLLRNSSEVLEGHLIEVDLPPTEVAFEADENQIKQIVWNLATNGLRAMKDGGRLVLGARIEKPGDDRPGDVVLEVSDEGVGIPPAELDAIFQPFKGTFAKGSGLGLAIVHRIVSDYGGEIQVRSTPGTGHYGVCAVSSEADGSGSMSERTVSPPVGEDTPERITERPRVLVADDERSMRELLSIVLSREGYDVTLAPNGASAIERLEAGRFDLLISDIKMPDMNGVDVLRAAKRIDPDILGIMITAFASADTAIEAMRLGAHDYLSKPFDVDELKMKVRNALEQRHLRQENVLLKRALGTTHQFGNIVGRSEKMLSVFKLIEQIARTDSTVLITGESGTGKEWVARAIHFYSLRRERPFVAVNCGAIPDTLLESELFGHMKGSFTGANVNKKGLIEAAERGTLFLDEIGEMNPLMQVKLLRVLQERRFRRLGGVEELEADMRVITATNQDLPKMVAEGKFREDFFYRINVIPIQLPALRDRVEDIPLLAEHFLGKYREQMSKPIGGIAQETMELLQAHDWPGNIRELENVIERAVALEKSSAILPESLPEQIGRRAPRTGPPAGELPQNGFDLEEHVKDLERDYIAQALRQTGGVQVKAAELLGMSFRSFRYYLKKYNLK